MLFATCLTRIRKLIPLTVFLGIAVNAQPDGGSISGEVGEATTGRPMAGVSVFVEGFPGGDTSDKKGEFRITRVPEGQYTLVLSFLGFATVQREGILVKNGQVTRLDKILMAERPIPLNEIVVSPGSYSVMGEHTSPRQTLSNEDIRIMGWAEDVTRAVQRIPGTTSDEFSAQFSIRGGDVDEVLVLLDGMQIYKPFHQKDFGGGLFSTIDIEVIEGVDLLTGGFAANYGNRMSGVLNMKSKTPAADQQLTSVGLSLMNARLFTMGNFGNNRGNYLFSARRGYLDLVNRLMNNEFKLEPKYYDLFGKTSWQLNRRHFLSLYGFHADDAYRLDERVVEPNTTWTNIDDRTSSYANSYAWANLKSSLRDNLFVETLAYGGRVSQHRIWEQFDLDPAAHLNSADINGKRVFDLAGLKQTWNLTLHPRLLFNLGGEFKGLRTDYDYSQSIRNELIVPGDSLTLQTREITFRDRISGNQIGAFLAGRFQVAAPLTLEAGLRYDDASYTGDRLWSPRVGMVLGLSPSTFLRAGWGYY
ncbi:MAG TPA: TonB-dependent receptor, partial [Calditrichia bacterium]|nr:TonB-dependent receptor [Calditrichia bacterium]